MVTVPSRTGHEDHTEVNVAGIYKRGKSWWLAYRVDGQRIRKSLDTTNERVARDRLKEIESLSAQERPIASARFFGP